MRLRVKVGPPRRSNPVNPNPRCNTMLTESVRHGSAPTRWLSRVLAHAGAAAVAFATWAGTAAAQQVIPVDPNLLQATIVSVKGEGVLCPPGSLSDAISGSAATVIFSQSVGGVQTAGCKLTFELSVPPGFSLSMPTTILRGVSLDRTRFERRYSFEGAGASNAFIEVLDDDFTIVDDARLASPSCGRSRRVKYVVDVSAQLQSQDTFFQLDSVDLDTTFRFGTDWSFCDRRARLVPTLGRDGDFCDGPQGRQCARGLVCDRSRGGDEGSCTDD
jgi:Domain of unknown function (DUF4360)